MKFSDLYGKTVIDITTSNAYGQVKRAIINDAKIAFFVTDIGFELQAQFIHSVGDTIAYVDRTKSKTLTTPKIDDSIINYKNLSAINAPVITTDGNTLGKICDYSVTADWRITRIITENSYINFKRMYNCNANVMIIKGKKTIKTTLESNSCNAKQAVHKTDVQDAIELHEINNYGNIYDSDIFNNKKIITINDSLNVTNDTKTLSDVIANDDYDLMSINTDIHGASLPTIISNYDFLIGRKVNKTIFNKNGDTIIVTNGIIDSETVKRCVSCNRLAELAIYSDRN